MRRRAALILLALAVFFASLAPLLRWYAFLRLAKIPANTYQATVLEARNATLLDYGTLRARTVPKVTIVQTLKGNVEESERVEKTAGKDVVVWDGLSYVVGPDGKMVSKVPERYIFDAPTARWSTATPSPAGASSSSGPSSWRNGTTSTSTRRPVRRPRSTTRAPARSAA